MSKKIQKSNFCESIVEKLKFIESVIGKYRHDSETLAVPLQTQPQEVSKPNQPHNVTPAKISKFPRLPRSSGIFDFKGELTPEYEQEVVQNLRK